MNSEYKKIGRTTTLPSPGTAKLPTRTVSVRPFGRSYTDCLVYLNFAVLGLQVQFKNVQYVFVRVKSNFDRLGCSSKVRRKDVDLLEKIEKGRNYFTFIPN